MKRIVSTKGTGLVDTCERCGHSFGIYTDWKTTVDVWGALDRAMWKTDVQSHKLECSIKAMKETANESL